jgi:drug/metabolite transporter (DMT)-like permease
MNYTTGILAAFTTLACWTIGTFAFTHAAKLASPKSVNRVRLLFAMLLLSVVTVSVSTQSIIALFRLPNLHEWLWLGLSGVVGLSIGDHFAFTAFKMLGSSRASLFNTFAPFAALLLGMILLAEHISALGMLGMAISVGGLLWFIRVNQKNNLSKAGSNRQELMRGVLFAILGAICQGLGIVLAKKGLMITHEGQDLSPVHATWIRMFTATVIIYVAGLFRTNLVAEFKEIAYKPQHLKPVLIGTVFGPVIGVSMSLLAASLIEVSLAQTIFSLLPITVMVVAAISGKEKIELGSFIAAIISVGGVFVLVWRDEIAQAMQGLF